MRVILKEACEYIINSESNRDIISKDGGIGMGRGVKGENESLKSGDVFASLSMIRLSLTQVGNTNTNTHHTQGVRKHKYTSPYIQLHPSYPSLISTFNIKLLNLPTLSATLNFSLISFPPTVTTNSIHLLHFCDNIFKCFFLHDPMPEILFRSFIQGIIGFIKDFVIYIYIYI